MASGRVRRAMAGNRPFVIGLVVLLVAGALVITGPLAAYLGQRGRVELLERQLTVLEAANGELERRAADLREPEDVEVLAREELGYVRPGEVPYVVVPPERDPSTISEPLEVGEPEARTWYQDLLHGLAGLFG